MKKTRGEKIKKRLIAQKMTQTSLAKLVGVNISQVSRWISGEQRVPVTRVAKIAKLLNMPVEDLL